MNPWQIMLRDLMAELQRVLESGEVLSDETQGAIAETMGNLVTRIQESQREEPPEQPEQQPQEPGGVPPQPLENPVSNDAQLLWVLSGQQPQAFISYLRTFPTPATQALLNNPQQLNSTIDHLSRMMPQGEPPVVDGIPHSDLNSSNIWGARYDQRTGRMRVRFQGGSEYEYEGVPRNIFNAFIQGNAVAQTNGQNQYGRWWRGKSPSAGAGFHQYIRQRNFSYRRIR